ncbi:PoNe immunity protein domain-containing protein [Chitinophaga barathri]|nr:PoNe immunity protein domain-containing protein [Chitinophaga barathri]
MASIRDNRKDADYFLEGINMVSSNLVQTRKNLKEEHPMSYYSLSDGLDCLIRWSYCLDKPVKELLEPCKEMIDAYTRSILPTDDNRFGGGLIYGEVLNICSLGVLLDCGEELKKFADRLQVTGFKDDLTSFLLSTMVPNNGLSGKLRWKGDKACQKLIQISQANKEDAQTGLLEYLDNIYYTRANMESDYNAHKKEGYHYMGYFSFESAAIVKIMGLNDERIQHSPYYPADLIHGDRPGLGELWKIPPTITPVQQFPIIKEEMKNKSWWHFWE